MITGLDWPPGEYNPFPNGVTPPSSEAVSGDGFCIRIHPDWIPAVLGALNTLTVYSTWKVNEDFASQQAERIINEIAGAAGLTVTYIELPAGSEPYVIRNGCDIIIATPVGPGPGGSGTGAGFDGLAEQEIEEMLHVIKINGRAYLVDPCQCGDTQLYTLSPSAVTINNEGDAVIGIDTGETGTIVVTDYKAAYKECTATAFAAFLLQEAGRYQGLLVDIFSLVVDVFTEVDEFIDLAVLSVAYLAGREELNDWADLLKQDVALAFDDPTYNTEAADLMEEMWAGTGVTKTFLDSWALRLPAWVNGVPVKWLLRDYIQYCRIGKVNEELARIHAACVAGTSYNPHGDYTYYEVQYSGSTYPVYIWSPDNAAALSDDWDCFSGNSPLPAGFDIYGLITDIDILNFNSDIGLFSLNTSAHRYEGPGANTEFGMFASATYRLAFDTVWPGITRYQTSAAAGALPQGLQIFYLNGATLNINKFGVIGAAL